MAGEYCDEGDDCFSGKCKENDKGEFCEPHAIGEVCYGNKGCYSKICSNNKCHVNLCIESGHDCKSTGKFCCKPDEECKALVFGGVPACGKCKQNGQKCAEDRECCNHYCNSYKHCDCAPQLAPCESDHDCCNHATCKIWKEGQKKKCDYERQENGADCKVNDECKSTNCENGKCKCVSVGKRCTVSANCCSNTCHVVDIENQRQECF